MSRFYEAMKRALQQESEHGTGQPAASSQLPVKPGLHTPTAVAVPFDPDATTPVRKDPLNELEDYLHSLPAPKPQPMEAPPAPVPLRLAERPAPRRSQPLAPAYERLVQRLFAFRGGRRHCCLLVASAVPGEGASTVARNLAVALGDSHRGRVVLVDANLRSPSQHDTFQTGTGDGLANVLARELELTGALREVPECGIAVLPAGRPSDIPPHLVTVSALQGVVTSLQSQFDWVVLDGPPVTTYPDASTLAVVADGTILVLRAERTRSEVAAKAMKVLSDAGAAVLGGVLNGRRYHIPEFIYRRL